jgi:heme-degrading monooxygenase HmoA
MFILHVVLKVRAGEEKETETDFLGPFKAAISAQEGFKSVALLRPDDGGDYVLSIAFENRSWQQKWVATDLHQQVWSIMKKHFVEFSIKTFDAV